MLLWVAVACIITPIIGVVAMVLNGELLYYLYRNRLDARLYHFSCVISAVNSFYFAFLVAIMVDIGTFVDGMLISAMYSPLLFHLPAWIPPDLLLAAFEAQIHTLWQLVPAPSILQWLSLSKSNKGSVQRMFLAYSVPVAFHVLGWVTMVICMPDDDLRDDMSASVSRVHQTNRSEFHVMGARIFDERRLSVLDIAIFDFLPSFMASYALFAISTFKIRSKLRSIGGSISPKTEQMQRRFFRAQIAQVMLPLILPSVPVGAIILGVLIEAKEMAAIPLLFTVVMWPIPAFTALLLLGFVRKTTKSKFNNSTSKSSTKKKSST